MHRVPREALHRVLHVLCLPTGNREEGDISNTEAAVLDDARVLAVRARVDGPVAPGVPKAAELVHWLEHLEHHAARGRERPLVHEPARHPRAGEVLAAGDDVDHPRLVLAACPDVLHREGAIAQDGHATSTQVVVGHFIVHTVADMHLSDVLSRVLDDAVPCHAPGIVVHDGYRNNLSIAFIQWSRGEVVVAVDVILGANDVHLRYVRAEVYVGKHPVVPRADVEVLKDPVLLGPGFPRHRPATALLGSGVLRAPPDVERTHLCLEL
mmetsp:Transcript_114785/g.305169  ORF Transcript_114785/g.305169 Transcript_114785/m.305169 type:complete len:267 (-) Transcript_114785:23-823(-)